jgi:hypothetical protein
MITLSRQADRTAHTHDGDGFIERIDPHHFFLLSHCHSRIHHNMPIEHREAYCRLRSSTTSTVLTTTKIPLALRSILLLEYTQSPFKASDDNNNDIIDKCLRPSTNDSLVTTPEDAHYSLLVNHDDRFLSITSHSRYRPLQPTRSCLCLLPLCVEQQDAPDRLALGRLHRRTIDWQGRFVTRHASIHVCLATRSYIGFAHGTAHCVEIYRCHYRHGRPTELYTRDGNGRIL